MGSAQHRGFPDPNLRQPDGRLLPANSITAVASFLFSSPEARRWQARGYAAGSGSLPFLISVTQCDAVSVFSVLERPDRSRRRISCSISSCSERSSEI